MFAKKQTDYIKMTYPHNRPGPLRPDLRASEINTGFSIKDFNKSCPSIDSISNIDWNSIRAVGKSDYGTSGVVFVETAEGACAIKGSQEIAVEFFSNMLFKALKISIPEMRLVCWNEEEFKIMQENLDRCTFEKNNINQMIRSRMNCPFLLVMSYIPSLTIREMGEKKAKHIFDANYPSSRDRLIRIGMIVATDTFINNCDRYPLIWRGLNGEENEGNPHNLLVKVKTDFLSNYQEMIDSLNMNYAFSLPFAIDNRPNLLRKSDKLTVPNLIKYHKELEKFLKELFEELKQVKEAKIDPIIDTDTQFRSIGKISNFIFKFTGYRFKAMSELQIMLGMVLQYVNIVDMGFFRIQTLYRELYSYHDNDWRDIWKNSFEKINLEFLEDSIGIIRKYLVTFDEIVLWVKSITLQQYIIKWTEEDEKKKLFLDKTRNNETSPLNFHKNLESILKIEGDLDEWELKDNSDPNEDRLNDAKLFEEERKKALIKLQNQQAEKNQWLDDKLKEYFMLDEATLVKQKKEKEEKEMALAREKEQKMNEEMETEKQKKILEEKEKEEERKRNEQKSKEAQPKQKKKGFMSFFSRKKKE